MKSNVARTQDAVADTDVTDLEETAALPVMLFPGGEAANSPMPSELQQQMERLIQLGESIEDKLEKIAKSLEKSPPSSPRKRKPVKSAARGTRKKTAKS